MDAPIPAVARANVRRSGDRRERTAEKEIGGGLSSLSLDRPDVVSRASVRGMGLEGVRPRASTVPCPLHAGACLPVDAAVSKVRRPAECGRRHGFRAGRVVRKGTLRTKRSNPAALHDGKRPKAGLEAADPRESGCDSSTHRLGSSLLTHLLAVRWPPLDPFARRRASGGESRADTSSLHFSSGSGRRGPDWTAGTGGLGGRHRIRGNGALR